MFRPGGELLFGVGEDALGRWSTYARPGVGFHGFDLGEDLLFGLAHRCSFGVLEPLRDYA